MWTNYIFPSNLDELLIILDEKGDKARVIAGATDLLLELEKGIHPNVDTLIDITRMPGLDSIFLDDDGVIHMGPLVTHNDAVSSRLLRKHAFPLVAASWQVGSPQIRNRGTIVGNLVTASPANDTIPPLMALNAELTITSVLGLRKVPLKDFYTGVRKTVLHPNEIVTEISFPAMKTERIGTFLKLGLRRAQAISLVNTAIIIEIDGGVIKSAVITLGSVAKTVIRASEAEAFLVGKILTEELIKDTADLAANASQAIDDIRGSANYRKAMIKTLVKRALYNLLDESWKSTIPDNPVLLSHNAINKTIKSKITFPGTITTIINGRRHSFANGSGKTILTLLREDAGLTGTKLGCGEGECGACTIHMDGKAVMGCLIPAPCADGSDITTIEGLSNNLKNDDSGNSISLHPVQQAFINKGAVQCGYCTPGFIMAASKLLEEQSAPTREQITYALTGNLCRCTGYYKIIDAVEESIGK